MSICRPLSLKFEKDWLTWVSKSSIISQQIAANDHFIHLHVRIANILGHLTSIISLSFFLEPLMPPQIYDIRKEGKQHEIARSSNIDQWNSTTVTESIMSLDTGPQPGFISKVQSNKNSLIILIWTRFHAAIILRMMITSEENINKDFSKTTQFFTKTYQSISNQLLNLSYKVYRRQNKRCKLHIKYR